ncbi:MAG: Xaa-Pro peptidase family protein [Alphaproteobacteria bacterium]|nr:Xaa-Pro peptidase family protein [Alphaproteobacteria bacterium]
MSFLSRAVFDYRKGMMDALMDREGYEALAFTSPYFFQFATNFHLDVQGWERPVAAIVPRHGEPFMLMCELSTSHLRFAAERQQLWCSDITFYAEHPRVTNRTWLVGQWADMAASVLKDKGLHRTRIGCDVIGPMAKPAGLLPGLTVETALKPMREMRLVKHPEELGLMRQAADFSDWIQDRYLENIRPGRVVQELDASMAALAYEEAAKRFPGSHLEMLRTWTLSGPASASPHGNGAPTGARIEAGHGLVNIVIPRLNGMVIENERTMFCGKPSPEQARAFHAALGANEAAIEAMVTGKPVSGIDAAAQSVIEKAGFGENILHRTGHGVGMAGHEHPDDMAFCHRPLMENEVYSAEPGIYLFGIGGFRIDDTVVVGDTPEVLTRAKKDLASVTVH